MAMRMGGNVHKDNRNVKNAHKKSRNVVKKKKKKTLSNKAWDLVQKHEL